ncbi:Transcription initiation factor TFIID subunit 13 [Coccomyxa sp. Obi]|nr:Transcription initiation factor TFIID subunit 13 [Coccomyxa sp. Obi]
MPAEQPTAKKKAGVKKVAGKKKKDAAASAGVALEPNLKKRGLFSKDLKLMMYGYGDAENPFSTTVDLLEDIVVDYVTIMAHTAMERATGRDGKMQPEDVLFLVRKDPRKLARAQELLRMKDEIEQARKGLADAPEHLVGQDTV